MRIDKYLAGKFGSRTKAARAVEEGSVLVNGKVVSPSYEVSDGDGFIFLDKTTFVSAGGYKLEKAISDFGLDVRGKVFADIGASTGGFTDCLLQNGARKVYCIDVGENQLDKRLLDKNIVVIDNFNARNLNEKMFEEPLDGVVADVSFISLTYILGNISDIVKDGKIAVVLIKPQFECGKEGLGKNGIVKDARVRAACIKKIFDFAQGCNLAPIKITAAPEVAGKNREYLVLLEKGGRSAGCDNLILSLKI